MKTEKVILALEEENDIVLININNALHNNQDIEAINFTKLLKENIDLIHNLKAELPSWGTLPKIEDGFSNSEEIIQNLKDKANKDDNLEEFNDAHAVEDENLTSGNRTYCPGCGIELYDKQRRFYLMKNGKRCTICKDCLKKMCEYHDGSFNLAGFKKVLHELEYDYNEQLLNNILSSSDKFKLGEYIKEIRLIDRFSKKTKETELKNVHNIQIIDDCLSLDCTIKNKDSIKDEDVTIKVPKMILKGNIITKNITPTSKTMKIDLEIECLNTISENGDNILATYSQLIK